MRCGSCLVKVGISSAILGVMTAILTSWFQAKRYKKIGDGDTFQFLSMFFMGISADFLMFHFVSRFTPFCKPTKIGSKDIWKRRRSFPRSRIYTWWIFIVFTTSFHWWSGDHFSRCSFDDLQPAHFGDGPRWAQARWAPLEVGGRRRFSGGFLSHWIWWRSNHLQRAKHEDLPWFIHGSPPTN